MILINNTKAIEIAKDKIRAWREAEFKINDLKIQNALVDGSDIAPFVARRDYLRDLTSSCEGKSIEDLRALILELGV